MSNFYKADAVIAASRSLTRTQKAVLAYLTTLSSKYGYAWASWDTIMADNAIGSRETLSIALKTLEAGGYIKIQHGARLGQRNASSRYFIQKQPEQAPKKRPAPPKRGASLRELLKKNDTLTAETLKLIQSLTATRKILEKSGAMTPEINKAMQEQIRALTTPKQKPMGGADDLGFKP